MMELEKTSLNHSNSFSRVFSNMFKHLVLSGGFYLGYSELGALLHLEEQQLFDVSNIQSFDGTSVGALLSVVLALNCTVHDLVDYFVERPWSQVVKELYSDITLDTLTHAIQEGGLFDKELLLTMIRPFLSIHFPNHTDTEFSHLTLKEFHEYTQKDVYMYSVKLLKDHFDLELVSLSHKTHPNLPLLDAIQMTSAVPFMIKPVLYHDEYYVDGGVLANYPLQEALKREISPDETLSIYLKSKYVPIQKTKYFLFNFQTTLMYRIVNHLRKFYERHHSIQNEILILCNHISMEEGWKQLESKENRKKFVQNGVESAILFVEYSNRFLSKDNQTSS